MLAKTICLCSVRYRLPMLDAERLSQALEIFLYKTPALVCHQRPWRPVADHNAMQKKRRRVLSRCCRRRARLRPFSKIINGYECFYFQCPIPEIVQAHRYLFFQMARRASRLAWRVLFGLAMRTRNVSNDICCQRSPEKALASSSKSPSDA